MKAKILMPQYVDTFKCTGGDCKETCCSGWDIFIDKPTYDFYLENEHPALLDRFQNGIEKVSDNSIMNHAKMKLLDHGDCPFLNEEGLCDIHATLGEDALSSTCITYPRIYNAINGKLELSLAISCPEVVNIMLLNANPITFDEVELDIPDKVAIFKNIQLGDIEYNYFWKIRMLSIEIVQDRNYSIESRLLILGHLYQHIDNLFKNKEHTLIPNIIEDYTTKLREGSFIGKFNDIAGDTNLKIDFFNSIFSEEITELSRSKTYKHISLMVVKGLIKNGEALFQIIDNYEQVLEKKYVLQEIDIMFENYFVNYIFQKLAPYDVVDVIQSFAMIAAQFVILKVQLIGLLSFNKYTDLTVLTDAFFSFDRNFGTDREFDTLILDYLKENNLLNIEALISFIKD